MKKKIERYQIEFSRIIGYICIKFLQKFVYSEFVYTPC